MWTNTLAGPGQAAASPGPLFACMCDCVCLTIIVDYNDGQHVVLAHHGSALQYVCSNQLITNTHTHGPRGRLLTSPARLSLSLCLSVFLSVSRSSGCRALRRHHQSSSSPPLCLPGVCLSLSLPPLCLINDAACPPLLPDSPPPADVITPLPLLSHPSL